MDQLEEKKQGLASEILEFLGPREAEAGPYSKVGKIVRKQATRRGITSSAAKDLIGRTLFGKEVKNVLKGRGDWRYIVYADGMEQAVTKDVIMEIMQEIGTREQVTKLVGKEAPSKVVQALKSLQYHKERQAPFTTKRIQKEWLDVRQKHVQAMGFDPVDYIYVESEKIYLPTEYAKILEASGVIKIKVR